MGYKTTRICPQCGKKNTDNWPLVIDGELCEGGCQECCEAYCDKTWWQQVDAINYINEQLDKVKA